MATALPDQSASPAATEDGSPSLLRRPRKLTIFHDKRAFKIWAIIGFLSAGVVQICRSTATPVSQHLFLEDGVATWWVSLPFVVLLVFLSFFRLWPHRLITGSGITTFVLSTALSIVLPGTHRPDVVIFALAFAALVIGGQHIAEFAINYEALEDTLEQQKNILEQEREIQQGLTTARTDITTAATSIGGTLAATEVRLKAAGDKIEELSDLLAFTEYRQRVQEAFRNATCRIISVTNLWPIDDEWWGDEKWENCLTYTSLTHKSERMVDMKSVIFVGEMPWPKSVGADIQDASARGPVDVRLSEEDFERVLGLIWRLVLADKARAHLNTQNTAHPTKPGHRADIRVVVASIPIAATVVDDEVFILLDRSYDRDTKPRGTQLTGRNRRRGNLDKVEAEKLDKETADAYESLMDRYLQCVRSSREYVESILRLACLATKSLAEDDLVFDASLNEPTKDLKHALDLLGRREWAAKKVKRIRLEDSKEEKVLVDPVNYGQEKVQRDYEDKAARIAFEFFKCYGPEGDVMFEDLGKGLL